MPGRVLLSIIALACMGWTQSVPATSPEPAKPPKTAKTSKKLTPEQKRGLELLKSAESQARSLEDAGMRVFAMLQAAQVYSARDKKKALPLLEDALNASRDVEEGHGRLRTRAELQRQIASLMTRLDPEAADKLIEQSDPAMRGVLLTFLMSHYLHEQRFERALEVIYGIGRDQEMPYAAVSQLMWALPPERSADFLALFSQSLASYRDHPPSTQEWGSDLTPMIVQFWKRLPANLVMEAIDEVLEQTQKAQAEDKPSSGPLMGNPGFDHPTYEMRLSQLLPVIRELDPGRAEALLREHTQLQAIAAAPATSGSGGTGLSLGAGGGTVSNGSPGAAAGGVASIPASPRIAEMQRLSKIINQAAKDPNGAVAQAALLDTAEARSRALDGIARTALRNDAAVSGSALDKMMEMAQQMEPEAQARALRNVAELCLAQHDRETARKLIEKAWAATEKVYKDDSDSSDPNQALKAFWPSSNLWRALLVTAGELSPDYALALLPGIPDAEIRTVQQIAVASTLLKAPLGPTMTMRAKKSGARMMITYEPGLTSK